MRAEDDGDVLTVERFSTEDISKALKEGWQTFRAMPVSSVLYTLPFVIIGMLLLGAIGRFGISPMLLPFAGGFMLVAPILLTGFFRMKTLREQGAPAGAGQAFRAFAEAPVGLWLLAVICAFLFLIWITDAGVLYSFMIGGEYLPYELHWLIPLKANVPAFLFWGSLMGSVIAYIIFAISAFSVALLYEGRATLVQAVNASVRGVVGNFFSAIAWGLIISLLTLLSIALLPLLLFVFPVLAYASFALYRRVLPV